MKDETKKQLLIAFGQTVRKRRLELDLSQESFAQKSQLHRTYISGIERGTRNVAFLNLIQIARALELTPEQLLAKVSSVLPEKFRKDI